MTMIDVYATAGTFADKHQLAVDLATAVMTIEQVPDIPMFRQNTAAFVHELSAGWQLRRFQPSIGRKITQNAAGTAGSRYRGRTPGPHEAEPRPFWA